MRDQKMIDDGLALATVSRDGVENMQHACHSIARGCGWWSDPITGEGVERDKLGVLMLSVTEIAEAAEGIRKDLMDDKIPTRKMVEVEIGDAFIRLFDAAEAWGLDIAGAMVEKLHYNANRADHKPENRAKEGGKKF